MSYTDEDARLVAALLAGFEVRTDEDAVEASHPGDALQILNALDKAGRLRADRVAACTGVAAGWCPNCGDCTCEFQDGDDTGWYVVRDPVCKLHGAESQHDPGGMPDAARRRRPDARLCDALCRDIEMERDALRTEMDDARAAGRLLPLEAETRETFGLRLTWDDGEPVEYTCGSRMDAEGRYDAHVRRRAEDPRWLATPSLIQRTEIHMIGPWREVTDGG